MMDHIYNTSPNGRIIIIFILVDSGWQIDSDYLVLNFSFIVVVVQLVFHFLNRDLSRSYDSF